MATPRFRSALLVLLLVPAPVPIVAAQTLRVQVLEEETLTPVPGALVGLEGASGKAIVRALANDLGRLVLTVPGPGTYRLRGDRIGHQGRTSDTLELRPGEVREFQLLLPRAVHRLREINVTAVKLCGQDRDRNVSVGTLWEEARKALLATEITRTTGLLELEVQSYELDLTKSLGVRQVINRATRRARTERPFAAISESVLRTYGFARRDSLTIGTGIRESWYYAPDAETLLSDYFLAGHCFRSVAGKGDLDGLVGIGFEPLHNNILPDVKGVLWLRLDNGGLDHIEYTYTRLDIPEPARFAGGRVAFARVGSGLWYVRQWCIRGPLVRAFSAGPSEARFTQGIAGYVETGGRAVPIGALGAGAAQDTSLVASWCKSQPGS
jgi:hypothetical protein